MDMEKTQSLMHMQMQHHLMQMYQKLNEGCNLPPYALLEGAMFEWLLNTNTDKNWVDKLDKDVYDDDDLVIVTHVSHSLQNMMQVYAMYKKDNGDSVEMLSKAIVDFFMHVKKMLSMVAVMIKSTNDAEMQTYLDIVNEFEGRLDRFIR